VGGTREKCSQIYRSFIVGDVYRLKRSAIQNDVVYSDRSWLIEEDNFGNHMWRGEVIVIKTESAQFKDLGLWGICGFMERYYEVSFTRGSKFRRKVSFCVIS